jgi:hypothetical protein
MPKLGPERKTSFTTSTRVGGKNPINLTKDSHADNTQPAFSPDG